MPITLKNGRVVENRGGGRDIFGISEDLEVTEGYDTGWDWWPAPEDREHWHRDEPPLSADEMVEFCTIMAERWRRLAERVKQPAEQKAE